MNVLTSHIANTATLSGLPMQRLIRFGTAVAIGAALIATLYVLKSALGINLLPGRTPVLHSLLYHYAR
jgi:hypothetical protein